VTKTLQTVYENGVLRPLEPLPLKEHQRVMVTVSDPADRWLDHEYVEKVKKDVALRVCDTEMAKLSIPIEFA
jgi:predicted DNA-binding antitoxin AbrB/MazE fold protein